MKLLPTCLLALASLLTQSAAAMGEPHLPVHLARALGQQERSPPSVTLRADRSSSSSTLSRRSEAQVDDERSIWQVLFGVSSRGGEKGRAASSIRSRIRQQQRRRRLRRGFNSKRGTCKSPTTSSIPPTATASGSAAPAPTNVNVGNTSDTRTSTNKIMAGYWPDWVASSFPPSSIDFSKFDILNYAFALPTASFGLSIPTDPSGGLLRQFVSACHSGNTSAVLSIGGWGGSTYFSPAVRTASSRSTFISNIMATYNKYNLDGIDLDWEYPNQPGSGNIQDPSDTANFQTFLQELRSALPKGALLTGAVSLQPWTGSNGQPVGSVARAAGAMDYVMLMNYDVWGSSSTPGPNAPLANLCGNSSQPSANAASAVKAWSAAGMPRSKILLGVPAYGYISASSKTILRSRRRRAVTLTSMDGSTTSGQINFKSLVSQGALKLGEDGLYDGAGGFEKYWDNCSDTPYLADGKTVVTYDDTSSIYDKGAFASAAGIGGVSMWSIDGDTKDWALTNAAIAGMSSTGAIEASTTTS